jgi:two-component system KDP operon response regulator KdpE
VNLDARGYRALAAASAEEALRIAGTDHPDAVVLDLGLPGIGGLQFLRSFRAWSDAPVVILSARETEPDKITGLDAGADDYVTKPFGMGELLARLRAALRRRQPGPVRTEVRTEDFVLDLAARRAAGPRGEVHLTPTEWTIVDHLVAHAGRLVTSQQLLQRMWGPGGGEDTAAVRVHLTHIRRKLEPDPTRPRWFVTEPGLGYRFTG